MNATGEKTFLIFSGGNDRAVLGFLRALRTCGKHAYIVARTRADKLLRTDFHRDVLFVREDHSLSMEVFADCVARVRAQTKSGPLVLLPSSEYFNEFLLHNRRDIEALGCEIPLVDVQLYSRLTGKRTATDLFAAAGFSVPRELRSPVVSDLPFVAKPKYNVSREGRSLYPRLLMTPHHLEAFRCEEQSDGYFFQEYVRGESLYLFFYLPRGGGNEITWSQCNLLQQAEGKSMLLAEPAQFHRSPAAVRMIGVLRELRFWGLGMIEVIRSGDREVFIEMNPRVWGPVQLCVDLRQPLLQAFIGDALYNDSAHFPAGEMVRQRRKMYCWLGGLAETLASGKRPVWHGARRSLFAIVIIAIKNDIYFRMDSWCCFVHEMTQALKLVFHRERSER